MSDDARYVYVIRKKERDQSFNIKIGATSLTLEEMQELYNKDDILLHLYNESHNEVDTYISKLMSNIIVHRLEAIMFK